MLKPLNVKSSFENKIKLNLHRPHIQAEKYVDCSPFISKLNSAESQQGNKCGKSDSPRVKSLMNSSMKLPINIRLTKSQRSCNQKQTKKPSKQKSLNTKLNINQITITQQSGYEPGD